MSQDSVKMMSHYVKMCLPSLVTDRYDEAIFAIGIIKNVTVNLISEKKICTKAQNNDFCS